MLIVLEKTPVSLTTQQTRCFNNVANYRIQSTKARTFASRQMLPWFGDWNAFDDIDG